MGIAEDVKQLRIDMSMNRKEFCEYFGIPYRTMVDWEAGKRKMPEYLFRLMTYKARIENLIRIDGTQIAVDDWGYRSEKDELEKTAYLSNKDGFIIFSYQGRNIRFKGPYSLISFDHIIEWDDGYLVVEARYSHSEELIEEYIDLKPILEDLYIDSEQFLSPIERVEVVNV